MHDPCNVYRRRYKEFIEEIMRSRPLNERVENSDKHHIVPKCLGGTDSAENLIYLTYREHFIAHKILTEENPDNEKLIYAYFFMCNCHPESCTPDEYELGRVRQSHAMHISMLGNNYREGKTLSEEHKQKISSASIKWHRDIGFNAESIEKIRQTNTGKVLGESTRKKIALANIGNANHLGHTHSLETRAKISSSHIGIPRSDETRNKISQSMRGKKFKDRVYRLTCTACGTLFLCKSSRGKYCENCR